MNLYFLPTFFCQYNLLKENKYQDLDHNSAVLRLSCLPIDRLLKLCT